MNTMMKALAAATALVTLPSIAQAAVIATTVNVAVPATTAGVYVNLVTGVTSSNPTAVPGWDINPWGSSTLQVFSNTSGGVPSGMVVANSRVADLATGTVINANSTYGQGPTAESFYTGGNHIFGFRFLNENTGATNYGYAEITTTASTNARPATITRLVYDDSGAAVTVNATGAVPEPASWMMMIAGFGAIGIAARRRGTQPTVRLA